MKGKQILRVNAPYRDHVDTEDGSPPQIEQLLLTEEDTTPDGPRYWDLWPQNFDYVYVLFTERGAPDPDPDRLKLVFEGERFPALQGHPARAGDAPGRGATRLTPRRGPLSRDSHGFLSGRGPSPPWPAPPTSSGAPMESVLTPCPP